MLHASRRCLVSVAPVTILVAGCATAAKPGYEITNPAYAQQAPVVRVGDRVRVSVAPDEPHRQRSVGTLLAFNTSHLRIALADGTREIEIPRSALTRLEVSRGRSSKWATGLVLGLLGGALIGAAVLLTIDDPPSGLPAKDWAAVGAVLGAPPGMVLGTAIGASIRADRWEQVSLDRLRVSFAPQRDGRFGLGLSVKF